MSTEYRCPECGTAKPSELEGVCARCLFQMSLAPETEEPQILELEEILARPLPATQVRLHSFGAYELLAEIARGGMGVVFKAKQMGLNRIVALKLVQAGRFSSTELRRRFRVEAEATALLDHPNIVPVYEVGELDGQPYFSMKLIEGVDLACRLQPVSESESERGASCSAEADLGGPYSVASDQYSVRTVAQLISTLARAVDHAHQRGVLHRDLKPGNILLDRDGTPYLTDFGIAKLVEGGADQTETLPLRGSPSYMSPEQAAGKSRNVTTATDIWSLGVILYQLLCGSLPFAGESSSDTLQHILTRSPTPPRQVCPSLPRDLETICLRCLANDPQLRYASAALLADDLGFWLEGLPIRGRRPDLAERLWVWCRRNTVIAGLEVALLLVLVSGIVITSVFWSPAVQSKTTAVEEAIRATSALQESKINLAKAIRRTGESGQRFEALRLLAEAARRTNNAEL